MSRPPRNSGGNAGGRPPGNRPPGARGPGAHSAGRRPEGERGFDDRPRGPRAEGERAQRPPRGGDRDGGEVLATSLRELRQHIPGGRPVKLPRSAAAPADPATLGRRGRGERRVAARAASAGSTGTEPQRIAKLLARAGVGSRRDIERMITEGRIAVHGRPLETPAFLLASLDGVTVDGAPVAAIEPTRLFAFHKPNGFLTTTRDPGGRPTIFDVLPPGLPRLVPVGRLDMNTEGLLLLTTDGALKRQLELPVNAVSRRYRVRAYGDISVATLDALIDGITIDGMHYGPIDADIEIRTGRNLWISMRLTEGKNREIRRVLEFLGLQVSRLIRVAYGPFELDDLPVRAVSEIAPDAIARLRKSFGKGIV